MSDTLAPPALAEESAETLGFTNAWVVWSHYHDAWWGPARSGYTGSLFGAGIYTEAEARKIERCRSRNPDGTSPETAMPLLAAMRTEQLLRSSSAKVVDLFISAQSRQERADAATTARPYSEWHEDFSSALWWLTPVDEPPYAGTPLDIDWPFREKDEAQLWWTPLNEIANAVNETAQRAATHTPSREQECA